VTVCEVGTVLNTAYHGYCGKEGEGLDCRLRLSLAVLWSTLVMCLCQTGEGVCVMGIYEHVCLRKRGGLTSILDKCMAWHCIIAQDMTRIL